MEKKLHVLRIILVSLSTLCIRHTIIADEKDARYKVLRFVVLSSTLLIISC
jgi:hypothetical protein